MSYSVEYYNTRWWVRSGTQLLGGYSANELRSYVFPLYSPQGMLVLQEAPPDHPHHQGIWTGLEIDGNDLWNAGSRNLPRHRQTSVPCFSAPMAEKQGEIVPELESLQPHVSKSAVDFIHQVHWLTTAGELLLYEDRRVSFRLHPECTQIIWSSSFSHPEKNTRLGQTKESGIGIRVPPHWETKFGGQIRNALGDVGEAECFDKDSQWLNIEGRALDNAVAGLLFLPVSQKEQCPWFTRDYGCHVYNPARQAAIELAPGESLTWSVQVLAYDGHRTVAEVDELIASIDSDMS